MQKSVRTLLISGMMATTFATCGSFAFAEGGAPPDEPQAQADHQRGGPGGRFARRPFKGYLAKLAKELGVTDEQKTKIKGIFKDFRSQNAPIRQTMQAERAKLRELIQGGGADESAIRAQSAKIAAAEADLAVARGAMVKQIQAVLTPDQVAKLKVLLQQREKNMKKHRPPRPEEMDPLE